MEFIETPRFFKVSKELFSDDELNEVQVILLQDPDIGVLIPGSGGLRKLRWSSRGKGKRGGLRIIYYWMVTHDLIYLLSVYKKSKQEDLAQEDMKYFRLLIEEEKS